MALGWGAQVPQADANTIQLGSASSLATLRCRVALTVTSDERDKTDIEAIPNAIGFISALTPITYADNQREKYIAPASELPDADKELLDQYGMCEYDRAAHATGAKKGTRRRVGLSAQQIVSAMEAAYGSADYGNVVNDNLHDVGGEAEAGVESKLTVAYTNLVPFLIKAVQELSEKINILEANNR
jgi:hypothetical protein